MQLFEGDGRRPSNPWRLDRATRERGLRGVVEVRRALRESQRRADARRGGSTIPPRPAAPPRRAA